MGCTLVFELRQSFPANNENHINTDAWHDVKQCEGWLGVHPPVNRLKHTAQEGEFEAHHTVVGALLDGSAEHFVFHYWIT